MEEMLRIDEIANYYIKCSLMVLGVRKYCGTSLYIIALHSSAQVAIGIGPFNYNPAVPGTCIIKVERNIAILIC